MTPAGSEEGATTGASRAPASEVPAGGDLHGRPTAAELVDAVAGFLREDLVPALDGPARHQARIAVRALEIVGRELRLGPAQAQAHRERLGRLGLASDRELADALRAGSMADTPELRAALLDDTADRLRVANPAWLPVES